MYKPIIDEAGGRVKENPAVIVPDVGQTMGSAGPWRRVLLVHAGQHVAPDCSCLLKCLLHPCAFVA
jgi:hypothetical protein